MGSNKDRRRTYAGMKGGKETLFAMTPKYLYRLDGTQWNRIDIAPSVYNKATAGHLLQSKEMIDAGVCYLTWESRSGDYYGQYSSTRKYNLNDLLDAPVITTSSSLASTTLPTDMYSTSNGTVTSKNPWISGIYNKDLGCTVHSNYNSEGNANSMVIDKYVGGLSTSLPNWYSYWEEMAEINRSDVSYPDSSSSYGNHYTIMSGNTAYIIGAGSTSTFDGSSGSISFKLIVEKFTISDGEATSSDRYLLNLSTRQLWSWPDSYSGGILPLCHSGDSFYFTHGSTFYFEGNEGDGATRYVKKLSLSSKSITNLYTADSSNIYNIGEGESFIDINGVIKKLHLNGSKIDLYNVDIENDTQSLLNSVSYSSFGGIRWYSNTNYLTRSISKTVMGDYYLTTRYAYDGESYGYPVVYQITEDGFKKIGNFNSSESSTSELNQVIEVFTLKFPE